MDELQPVVDGVLSLRDTVLVGAGTVISMAVSMLAINYGVSWLFRLFRDTAGDDPSPGIPAEENTEEFARLSFEAGRDDALAGLDYDDTGSNGYSYQRGYNSVEKGSGTTGWDSAV